MFLSGLPGERFKPGARKSRGAVRLIGWPRNGTRFSARSLLCPRLDSGDPPDALAALSGTIRQHPGRSSRPLADRLRLDGLPSPSLSHPQEGLRRATPWRARLPGCTGNQTGGPPLSHNEFDDLLKIMLHRKTTWKARKNELFFYFFLFLRGRFGSRVFRNSSKSNSPNKICFRNNSTPKINRGDGDLLCSAPLNVTG